LTSQFWYLGQNWAEGRLLGREEDPEVEEKLIFEGDEDHRDVELELIQTD
jgi:hypothetical protein